MPTWSPLFLLPNMHIQNPFENEYLAIAPEDERCAEINSRNPTFLPFLDRFTDAFRRKIIPSVMLLRDAPQWVKSWEPVSGFRDILSICAVVLMLEYRFHSRQGDYEQALGHILKPTDPKEQ
jgi:hypothetical protein